jgi:hypothetical protein
MVPDFCKPVDWKNKAVEQNSIPLEFFRKPMEWKNKAVG